MEQAAGQHSAALAGGLPPAKPATDTVTAAKQLLVNARKRLPKPDNSPSNQEPDPWHTAIAQMFHDDAMMTTIGNRRDEYQAAGPEATAAWRQTIDTLAHQCRHHDAELQNQTSQTPTGPGRRARRRLLAQATGASRSALHAYHEAIAGPRREMPVRYGEQAQEAGLHRLFGAEQIRQVAASDAAPIVMIHLETGDDAETVPILVAEHRSELHVLMTTDAMPPGLPAENLLHTHLSRQIEEILTEAKDDPPAWSFSMLGLFDAAVAGVHDTPPATFRQLGATIRSAVNSDPHAMTLLEDAFEDQLGYYLGAWLFMHCGLLPTTDGSPPDDDDTEPPFYTPEQNRALMDAGTAAGISPYGLKRLAIVIGADTEPDYIERLPKHSPATATAVHAALRQAIPDQPNLRQALAQILQTELGIADPDR